MSNAAQAIRTAVSHLHAQHGIVEALSVKEHYFPRSTMSNFNALLAAAVKEGAIRSMSSNGCRYLSPR